MAIADHDEEISRNPKNALPIVNRGITRHRLDDSENALADFNEAIALDPKLPDARLYRAFIRIENDELDKAIEDFAEVIRLNPMEGAAFETLALIRAVSSEPRFRNGPLAIEYATKACALGNWKNDASLEVLACAYVEAGQFDEAKKRLQQAIDLAPKKDVETRAQMMKLFNERKPYHEEPKAK